MWNSVGISSQLSSIVAVFSRFDKDVIYADHVRRYINQNNFLRSVKNFKVDVTRTPLANQVAGIHWQVAQGSTLENIEFYMSSAAGSTQSVRF